MISAQIGPAGYYARIEGMDPRADWLFGPGRQDYLPHGEDQLIPIIISLHDDIGVEFVIAEFLQEDSQSPFFISSYYVDKLNSKEWTGRYFVAITTKEFFDQLAEEDSSYEVLRTARKEIRLGAPLRASALPNWKPRDPIPRLDDPPGPPDDGWPRQTVVVGVIDDGIAFAHERFRTKKHGSRVQSFWRMDPPNTSSTVAYGSEIVKGGVNGIDALLSSSTGADGSVDEDRLYRAAGLIDFAEPEHKAAAWRIAHGTHVLDLAAGEEPAKNVRNRPIVCVQLQTETTRDTSGADLYPHVLLAVDHILQRADRMATPGELPVVINFSYGLLASPHDGTSALERALNQRILARPGKLQIVLPAGNSHLSRCHAEVKFARQNSVVKLNWRVQPDDQTPSRLEIWLPHAGPVPPAADRVKLSVVAPGGAATTSRLGETDVLPVVLRNDGEVICAAQAFSEPFPTERRFFLVHLQPTARLHPTATPQEAKRIAPHGVWTIRLHNVSLGSRQTVQAWIQRDDTPYGYPIRGRQSYFDDPRYLRFSAQGREIEEDPPLVQPALVSPVKRASSINAIATGAQTIVAGGHLRKELRLARYSAGEPITPTRNLAPDPNYRKPDAALVSDDSKVHAGVLAAGSRSGARVAMNGTSIAAPQLARWIADHLAAGNLPGRAAVRTQAQLDEAAPPTPKPPLPPQRGGWGRMLSGWSFPRPRYWP
jgi:hypothetical protein